MELHGQHRGHESESEGALDRRKSSFGEKKAKSAQSARTPGARTQGARRSTPDARCPTPDAQRPTLDARLPIARRLTPDASLGLGVHLLFV